MTAGIWRVNGRTHAGVDPADRAVQFGDGLFETCRVSGGRVEYLQRHLARLRHGVQRLGMEGVDFTDIERQVTELARDGGTGVLKLILSRGVSARGYRVAPGASPTLILGLHPAPPPEDLAVRGIRARICDLRLAVQPALAGIKHLNRLEQVLARAEWSDPQVREGLLLDTRGRLVEGTMSNLFLVRDGRLFTPSLRDCGVSGVMRSVIMDSARAAGIDVTVGECSPEDAARADELFVCNSIIGIWPVRRVDELREYGVGAMTRRLMEGIARQDDEQDEHWYPI